MLPAANFANIIEAFVHSIDDIQKLFRDITRPTKLELNNLWNKVQENAANVPNPTCIEGAFELTIYITNGSE